MPARVGPTGRLAASNAVRRCFIPLVLEALPRLPLWYYLTNRTSRSIRDERAEEERVEAKSEGVKLCPTKAPSCQERAWRLLHSANPGVTPPLTTERSSAATASRPSLHSITREVEPEKALKRSLKGALARLTLAQPNSDRKSVV